MSLRAAGGSTRAGVATIWAMIVLTVLAAVSAAAVSQFLNARRAATDRANKVQALWLARSGVELAADKLRADADGYTGETVKLAGGEVRVKATRDGDVFRVESEATAPVDAPRPAVRAVVARVTRAIDGGVSVRVLAGD